METARRSGVLLLDKPPGMTSHDVVSAMRKRICTRKIGHAGTLDPMATGLLVLGVNAATRLLTYLVGLDKEYRATIRLGGSTPTDDADSPLDALADPGRLAGLGREEIREAMDALTGAIQQVPSAVSAVKVAGRRAYERVRAGEEVALKPRPVTVSAFEVLEARRTDFLDLDVRIACSTGTYVRALARDLGSSLGVGGHLTALRRTRVGPFTVAEACAPEEVEAHHLREPTRIAGAIFPVLGLTYQQAVDLGHGKRLDLGSAREDSGPVAACAPDGRLVGLVAIREGVASVIINFPEDGDGA